MARKLLDAVRNNTYVKNMPKKVKCPRCKQEIVWENTLFRPFCSEKCKLIDLGKWAEEKYRVPGEKVTNEKNQKDEEEENSN